MRHVRRRAVCVFATAALVGCAPGAWQDEPEFDRFIDKPQAACPYARSGQWQIDAGTTPRS